MKKILSVAILFTTIISCSTQKKETDGKIIIVDVEKTKTVDIRNIKIEKVVKLDNYPTDALIGEFNRFYEFGSCFFIQDNPSKKLKKFDKEGKYLGYISNLGRADNEYIGISETWLSGDTVFIYDINGAKILTYLDTVFVRSQRINNTAEESFQALIPRKNGGYIGKQMYRGEPCNELAVFDCNYNFIKTIGNFTMPSGIMLGYPLYSYNDEILYWHQLDYDIFSIDTNDSVQLKYHFDFLDKSFPKNEKFRDEYDIIDLWNANIKKYAGYIHGVIETDEYLMFNYGYNKQPHLFIYDKQQKTPHSFVFTNGTDCMVGAQPNNSVLIINKSEDDNDNFVLYYTDVKTILEYNNN